MAGMVVALARMTAVKALVISADPALRKQLRVALGAVGRRTGGSWEALEAENGIVGLRMAWRELPDLVVADEIASGAGAFAVAKDLRGAQEPFPGAIILVLARRQDEWLAKWAGAEHLHDGGASRGTPEPDLGPLLGNRPLKIVRRCVHRQASSLGAARV
jgi:CheY-like chemotaxis protein